MLTAYFDCQYGASGDMLLGALIDAGLDFTKWQEQLAGIALPANSFHVSVNRVARATISATKFDVTLRSVGAAGGEADFMKDTEHAHPTVHSHDEGQEHSHSHSHHDEHHDHHHHQHGEHTHDHTHLSEHGRSYKEIIGIIEQSKISTNAKQLASRIFARLAAAEASVHGVDLDQVHFHEVGSVDAIVDMVGFAIAFDMMQIECTAVSAVPLGSGYVKTAHGVLPVPAPAVLNMLTASPLPVAPVQLEYECLTPTGAAILCELNQGQSTIPAFRRIEKVGYGAGSKNPPGVPNICRVVLGYTEASAQVQQARFRTENIAIIETNIDDMTPQAISAFVDLCFEHGSLDVNVTPCVMKKGRSGHLLTVLCKPEDQVAMRELMLLHTSALGARSYEAVRSVAEREIETVALSEELAVRIKIGRDLQGKIINVQPEFDDCVELAKANDVPLKDAYRMVLARCKKAD